MTRGSPQHRRLKPVSFAVLMLAAVGGCGVLQRDPEPPPQTESEKVADLRMGYGMLADALGDEAQLDMLELFKKVTLDGPSDPVDEIIDEIAVTSQKRSSQLERLRALSPDVSGQPPTSSPVGDAIRTVAKELGEDEMLSREGDFDTRFLVLQAQATRMVAAMCKALARFDPNEKRVKWLEHVASEYEDLRDDLIGAVQNRGGTAQDADQENE